MMWPKGFLFAALLAASPDVVHSLKKHTHDGSFQPDIVLSVTRRNVSIAGTPTERTLVNNSIPAPEIRLAEGQTTWIRVYNDMADANLTMHWHGLSQAAWPFADGTPMASQWPIPPNHFFDYELSVDNGTAGGTFFYHSHVGFQGSSAAGALIINDGDNPPYKTYGERTFFIQEYWNQTDDQVEQELQSIPSGWPGDPNCWLINGKGISNFNAVDASTRALEIINIKPGKTYRFRFVGAMALNPAMIGFEKHNESFQIIEADGRYTKPQPVDAIQIASGQRYSALFQAKTCAELEQDGQLDYYVQVESRIEDPADPNIIRNYAILRYENTCGISRRAEGRRPSNKNPAQPPATLPPLMHDYLEYKLQPLQPNNFPSASEVTRRVIMNFRSVSNQFFIWPINDYAWSESNDFLPNTTTPNEPYLVSLYKNQSAYLPNYDEAVANGGMDPSTKTYPAKMGEVLEIVLQQHGGESPDPSIRGSLISHPWHAHGTPFYDAGGGEGVWNTTVAEQKLAGTTPVLRDTTMVYAYSTKVQTGETRGWRVWRLRVNDPGVWMVHCHLLLHMIGGGMQTVWVHGDAEDILTVPGVDVEGYLEYGGSVYGNETHAPQMVHFSEMGGRR